MTLEDFKDAVSIAILEANLELDVEVHLDREPDEYSCTLTRPDEEWQYFFAATSYLSMMAAIDIAIENGDLDDAEEKYPDFW